MRILNKKKIKIKNGEKFYFKEKMRINLNNQYNGIPILIFQMLFFKDPQKNLKNKI